MFFTVQGCPLPPRSGFRNSVACDVFPGRSERGLSALLLRSDCGISKALPSPWAGRELLARGLLCANMRLRPVRPFP